MKVSLVIIEEVVSMARARITATDLIPAEDHRNLYDSNNFLFRNPGSEISTIKMLFITFLMKGAVWGIFYT